ncbi:hypothetical protein AX17_002735 [Amanita inopinata Kibby_2008]|nr:hypothetical protein AX17_002735 [Amanita inopinata Kibby_2008]
MSTVTLYDVLGVQPSASDNDIRKAYKRKALETHPDRLGPHASESQTGAARTRFQKVHEAFDVLSDPQRRKAYDARSANSNKPGHPPKAKVSEEQVKRAKDRMDWALQQQKCYEERMKAFRMKGKEQKDALERKTKETEMTQEFLRELCASSPEWEERRRRIYQQKAQREKAGSKQHPLSA